MRLEHYSSAQLKKEIQRVIGAHLDLKTHTVFFFGSRVTGKGDDRSDIDIGIEGPEPIPKNILRRIKEEMDELPILYKIDIVDFRSVSPAFASIAKQKIEPII